MIVCAMSSGDYRGADGNRLSATESAGGGCGDGGGAVTDLTSWVIVLPTPKIKRGFGRGLFFESGIPIRDSTITK